MNPRQRRGTLLMILAGAGALTAFAMVMGYVSQVRADARAEVGPLSPAFKLVRDVKALQPVPADAVVRVQVPRRWLPQTVVRDDRELQGMVAATDLLAGGFLQKGMIIDAPALKAGQREIAIRIDAETGVAGKVRPGTVVDVYSTFDSAQKGSSSSPPCVIRVLSRVRVIDVGELQTEKGESSGNQVVPVTFALDSSETLKLAYAESFAKKVRLALVGGTQDPQAPAGRLCSTPSAGTR